jgi:hypothetical protein
VVRSNIEAAQGADNDGCQVKGVTEMGAGRLEVKGTSGKAQAEGRSNKAQESKKKEARSSAPAGG